MAIHASDPNLFPLVIVISNDPDDLLSPDDDATRNPAQSKKLLVEQKGRTRTRISDPEPVTDIVTPIKTVVNTRTAHGLLGVAELDSALRDAFAPRSCEGFMQVRVWPEPEANSSGTSKAVSMSWWLSGPIRAPTQPNRAATRASIRRQHRPPGSDLGTIRGELVVRTGFEAIGTSPFMNV